MNKINNLEMFIYRALNEETHLYNIGIVIAEDKETAHNIVCKSFNENYSVYVFSKENLCDLFASSVIDEECININELCSMYGYRTETELKLQKKINAIQPLINDLAVFKNNN